MNEAGGDPLGMEAIHSQCLATSEVTQTHFQGHLYGNLVMQLAMILLPRRGTQRSCHVAHHPATEHFLLWDDCDLPFEFHKWQEVSGS